MISTGASVDAGRGPFRDRGRSRSWSRGVAVHVQRDRRRADRLGGQLEAVQDEVRRDPQQRLVLVAGGLALGAVADDHRLGSRPRPPPPACGRPGRRRRRGRSARPPSASAMSLPGGPQVGRCREPRQVGRPGRPGPAPLPGSSLGSSPGRPSRLRRWVPAAAGQSRGRLGTCTGLSDRVSGRPGVTRASRRRRWVRAGLRAGCP